MILELRPMPVETVSGLTPPLHGFPYFKHAHELPFQPTAASHCLVNAWFLADASFLVYGGEELIQSVFRDSPLPAQGFQLDWLGTAEDNRGMILASDTAVIVVFRGTRLQAHTLLDRAEVVLLNQADLWTDSQFLPSICTAGGKVHAGFLKAFAEVRDRLDALAAARRPEQALWLTGHSLGGALATLAAAHLGPAVVTGLYTYGSPRVGDAAFSGALPGQSHHRFVHRDDWVPTLPPEFLGYVHSGTLHSVTGAPPRNFLDDLAALGREVAACFRTGTSEPGGKPGQFPFKLGGVADHMPVYYATLLWNALVDQQVSS